MYYDLLSLHPVCTLTMGTCAQLIQTMATQVIRFQVFINPIAISARIEIQYLLHVGCIKSCNNVGISHSSVHITSCFCFAFIIK